jgi:hypothetical protein
MLALAIASRLARGGNDTLLTCFNWRLAEYLRENAKGVAATAVHFHELCRQVARDAGLAVPEEPSEEAARRDYFERVLPSFLEQGAAILGPRYDAMVVDEAQDFISEWWAILLSLHRRSADGYLFLFSDDNQDLYGRGAPEGLADLTLPLPANLRSTRPIHEFVSVFHGGSPKPPGRGPGGRPVEVLGYRDEGDLANLLSIVLKNLQGEGVPLEDVVVLTPARHAKSALRKLGRANGYELSDQPEPGKVFVSTIHGFKGLERPVVILAEIGERHQEDLARYLYVGGSRARNHLIVLAAEPTARTLRQLAGVQPD